MYQSDSGARPARQMVDVSALGLTCSDCNVAITELPFMPTKREDGTYGRLYCRDCNRKRRPPMNRGGRF